MFHRLALVEYRDRWVCSCTDIGLDDSHTHLMVIYARKSIDGYIYIYSQEYRWLYIYTRKSIDGYIYTRESIDGYIYTRESIIVVWRLLGSSYGPALSQLADHLR
jgi:hypothetical protein